MITLEQFMVELRLGDSAEERELAQRRLAFASEAVVQYAPLASDIAHTEAAVRLGAFHFDMPNAGSADRFANPLRSSGAARLLTAYRQHGGGLGL